MATVAEKVHEYFASLNPLAHKILQETDAIKAQYGTEWDTFTVEKQDEILDNHFVNPEVKAQYPDKNEYPECFPRLKVNCGEKIVVDFDNDVSNLLVIFVTILWYSGFSSWKTIFRVRVQFFTQFFIPNCRCSRVGHGGMSIQDHSLGILG